MVGEVSSVDGLDNAMQKSNICHSHVLKLFHSSLQSNSRGQSMTHFYLRIDPWSFLELNHFQSCSLLSCPLGEGCYSSLLHCFVAKQEAPNWARHR